MQLRRDSESVSKQSGIIHYPNNIQDRQTVIKLREIIDHLNATKTAVAQNQSDTVANATAIQALPPSYLTAGDVNAQIGMALGSNGAIYQKIIDILKLANITLPTTRRAEEGNE